MDFPFRHLQVVGHRAVAQIFFTAGSLRAV
jgi:hypothetical protein